MIYDICTNSALYFDSKEPFYKALRFAAQFNPSLPDGRYEIDGKAMYAMVMTYQTKPADEGKFESHRNYADIQLLLDGCELLDVSLDKDLKITEAYSEEKDVIFYAAPKNAASILLQPGQFALLYPHDIHRPCIQIEQPKSVRKMVIKVRVSQ